MPLDKKITYIFFIEVIDFYSSFWGSLMVLSLYGNS